MAEGSVDEARAQAAAILVIDAFRIVLGHPKYYPRFGFSPELAKHLESPFSESGDAWMAMELIPGALSGVSGTIRYPAAFGLVAHG